MAISRIFREIKTAIEEGGFTDESLIEKFKDDGVDTTKKLNNQIRLVNAMGFYPTKDEDGVYTMITEEEFDAIEDEKEVKKAEPKFTANPHNRIITAKTKLDNKLTASANASDRFKKKGEDVLLKLKASKADLDYRIAKIELLRLKQKLMEELKITSIEEFDKVEDLDEHQAGVKAALDVE